MQNISKASNAQVLSAAIKYLAHKGLEPMQDFGSFDLVVESVDGSISFIDVSAAEGSFIDMRDKAATRRSFERRAAMWLSENDVTDTAVRYDQVDLVIINPDKAMVRHHINALG